MRELVIAGWKDKKAFWAKVDLSKKQKVWTLVDSITNLVKAVNRSNLDSYSVFIREE